MALGIIDVVITPVLCFGAFLVLFVVTRMQEAITMLQRF
jgi:hypothetical protein